jgi:Xaa-Pro aminopeptidase
MHRIIMIAVAVATAAPAATPRAASQVENLSPASSPVLTLRVQAKLRNTWLAERLDILVPALMRENRVDMWILVAREYAEDPVVSTMLDAESFHARRRTILVFFDPGNGQPVERMTVSRYGLGALFTSAWNPDDQPDQWKRLAELVRDRNPRRIAINTSPASALADGLTHSQHDELMAALPPAMRDRVVPAEPLAIGWLETRTASEMALYPQIVRTAHAIIAEGFSNRTITPGKTTSADVEWWYRERIAGLKLATWFQPSVGIYRKGMAQELSGDTVIQPGDLLWTDFGITYLGLNTDTQHMAYVLRPGETRPPAGLRAGIAAANAVQDAVTSSFRNGLTGNDILVAARTKALGAKLNPLIYSHPLGYHGHGAGAAIGFWDDQKPSPRGDHALRPSTAWSIELSATQAVPEWDGQVIPFRLEEDAFFDGTSVRYIDGRQTAFHLIKSGKRRR